MAGWLVAVSGTEERRAGQIEANAARHQVFPDVQVLPVAFLLWQSDLGAGNSHHMLEHTSLSHSTKPAAVAGYSHAQTVSAHESGGETLSRSQ